VTASFNITKSNVTIQKSFFIWLFVTICKSFQAITILKKNRKKEKTNGFFSEFSMRQLY
jgi:hypothetical protein